MRCIRIPLCEVRVATVERTAVRGSVDKEGFLEIRCEPPRVLPDERVFISQR